MKPILNWGGYECDAHVLLRVRVEVEGYGATCVSEERAAEPPQSPFGPPRFKFRSPEVLEFIHMPSFAAARVKLRSLATARKARRSLASSRFKRGVNAGDVVIHLEADLAGFPIMAQSLDHRAGFGVR